MPSLEELLADHGRFMRDLAADVVGDAQLGEDLMQEAWLRSSGVPPALERPQAWLRTVVRNLGLSLRRSEASRRDRERETARPEALPSALDELEHSELLLAIAEAVQALPDPYREVILKRYWENRTPAQIAAGLGLPVATVKSRLQRGIARLRAEGKLAKVSPFEALLGWIAPRNDVLRNPTWPGTLLMKTHGKVVAATLLIVTSVLVGVLPRLTGSKNAETESRFGGLEQSTEVNAVAGIATDSGHTEALAIAGDGERQSALVSTPVMTSIPGRFAIAGRVVDEAGEALPGAAVVVCTEAGGSEIATAMTSAEGHYTFEFSTGGVLELSASHPSCIARDTQVYLKEPQSYELADLVLRGGRTLIGYVEDEHGVGVAGATLLLLERPDRTGPVEARPLGESAADGSFSYQASRASTGNLGVLAEGFVPARVACPMDDTGGRLRIRLVKGWSARVGIVGDDDAGVPLRLAVLPATGSEIGESELDWALHTYMEGLPIESSTQTLTGLAPGTSYYVQIERQLPYRSWMRCGAGATLREDEPSVVLRYQPRTRVLLSARDHEGGAPIAKLQVMVRDDDGAMWGVTESEAHATDALDDPEAFEFTVDAGDTIRLHVSAKGYKTAALDPFVCEVGQGEISRTVELRAAKQVNVIVRDSVTGTPIEGAAVRTEEVSETSFTLHRGWTELTDSAGRAAWTYWAEESAELVVSRSGYSVHREELLEPYDPALVRSIDLVPLGQVLVNVTGRDGRPAVGVAVRCEQNSSSGGLRVEENSDLGGVARFANLSPGAYEFSFPPDDMVQKRMMMGGSVAMITIEDPDSEKRGTHLELRAGDSAELHLELPPLYFLEGQVLEGGVPLAGARVHALEKRLELQTLIHHSDPGEPEAVTGELGFFRIDEVEGGEVTLYVEHDSRRFPWSDNFQLDGDLQGMRVELPRSELHGTVRDFSGLPIAGAEIEVLVSSPDGSLVTPPRVMTVDSAGIFSISSGKPTGEVVVTDATGSFSVQNPPLGYVLRIEASGRFHRSARQDVLLEVEGQREVDFQLASAGELRIEIAMEDQTSPRNAYVQLARQGPGEQPDLEEMLGLRSEAIFSGLEPGEWEFMVSGTGSGTESKLKSATRRFEVRPSETTLEKVVL